MQMRKLGAAVAAASFAAVTFLSFASPASAWTKKDCEEWNKTHEVTHPDCYKYTTTTKAKPTTTKGEATTTTTVKATTSTTTAVKPEEKAPAVKTQPKFTG